MHSEQRLDSIRLVSAMKPRRVCSRFLLGAIFAGGLASSPSAEPNPNPTTYCNPINISYQALGPGFREAADPAVVSYKGDLYLFASKSGGYWWSNDMRKWNLVRLNRQNEEIPMDWSYAPALLVFHDTLFYNIINTANFATTDPKNKRWVTVSMPMAGGDPALFVDDDDKVYKYVGLAGCGPIQGAQLDTQYLRDTDFSYSMPPDYRTLIRCDNANRGWERTGNNNEGGSPFVEGAWMTKHNGIYYLQYAAPGTEYRTYADGVYTSRNPLGPFTYANYSPVSFKPRGFVTGAGHGSTFQDKHGNWWHAGTAYVCYAGAFERRIDIFPAGFDSDDVMYVNTTYGDFPIKIPTGSRDHSVNQTAGWMLLSYKATAQASSGASTSRAFDENIQTWWSAQSGNPGEWLSADLGKECRINSIQVNFAEEGQSISNRPAGLYQQYKIEGSLNGSTWFMMADKSTNTEDVPHDYVELLQPMQARYVKITNVYTIQPGRFSIRDLRIFGSSMENPPAKVTGIAVNRHTDQRDATIGWNAVSGAVGYIVRFGTQAGKRYNHYQVFDSTQITIRSLNNGVQYFFDVEAFNRTGTSAGGATSNIPAPVINGRSSSSESLGVLYDVRGRLIGSVSSSTDHRQRPRGVFVAGPAHRDGIRDARSLRLVVE